MLDLYSNSSEELARIRLKEKGENAKVEKLSKQKYVLTQVLAKLTTKIKKLQETQKNLSKKNLLLQKGIFDSAGTLVQTQKEFKKAQILEFTSNIRRSATIGFNYYNLFDFHNILETIVSFPKTSEEEKIFLSGSSSYDRIGRAINRIDVEHFNSKLEFTDTFIAQLKKTSLDVIKHYKKILLSSNKIKAINEKYHTEKQRIFNGIKEKKERAKKTYIEKIKKIIDDYHLKNRDIDIKLRKSLIEYDKNIRRIDKEYAKFRIDFDKNIIEGERKIAKLKMEKNKTINDILLSDALSRLDFDLRGEERQLNKRYSDIGEDWVKAEDKSVNIVVDDLEKMLLKKFIK